MDILDQLKWILADADADFWQQELCTSSSVNVTDGIRAEMTAESGRCGWKVTWPDRNETKSDETFSYWKDAKDDLRAYLTRKLKDLAYAASPPAKCEMFPT